METAAVCALAVLRTLGIVAVAALAVLMSGCSGEAEKNPLMIKGKNLRESGDAKGAREYFRRAIALHPDDPAPYLALAQVCDEELDAPLEAAFAYQLYLRLLPEDAAEREPAERMLAGLRERAVLQLAGDVVPGEKYRELEKENASLRARTEAMGETMIRQQQRLNELYAESRRSKSKKGK